MKSKVYLSCIGNLLQHFDSALFGFLAPYLAPIMFPDKSATVALISTYAFLPLGLIAKPLGALCFGSIGDKFGRGKALFYSLLGMGCVSFAMAFMPTPVQVGALAPIALGFFRLLQNFFSSGEVAGGGIFLLENTKEKSPDLLSSIYSASTLGGILLASAALSGLCMLGKVESLWRALYLLGGGVALFGVWARSKLLSADSNIKTTRKTTLQSLLIHKKPIFRIACVSGFSYALYSMSMVLTSGLIPLISKVQEQQMIHLNSALLVLDLCLLPLFGWISSKISREKLMCLSACLTALSAAPLCCLLSGSSLWMACAVRSAFVILGVAFSASFHAWAQQEVKEENRYTVISLGYALGSQLLGAPTAALSLWLFHICGSLNALSFYLIVLGLLSAAVTGHRFAFGAPAKKKPFTRRVAYQQNK